MDIVERLDEEKMKQGFSTVCFPEGPVYVLYGNASKEFERLRQRVELLEGYLNGALNLVENFAHCDTTDARKALEGK